MNRERIKIKGQTIALAVSLLLHGLVLFGLGTAATNRTGTEPELITVYLSMPTSVPVKIPDMKADAGKRTVLQPVQVPAKPEAFTDPVIVKHQPTPESVSLEKKPVMKVPLDPVPADTDEPVIESGKLDPSKLNTKAAPEAAVPEDEGIAVRDSVPSTPDPQTLAVNPQSSILNSQSASALLAFAGNPSSLGMFGMENTGQELVEAAILSLPEPAYPVLSRRRGEEGKVIVEVTISAQGAVSRARIKTSSSYQRLDRAALAAVKKALFNPAAENGTPVESVKRVAYRFELENQ